MTFQFRQSSPGFFQFTAFVKSARVLASFCNILSFLYTTSILFLVGFSLTRKPAVVVVLLFLWDFLSSS